MILSITSSLCPTPLIAVIIPSASSSIFWNSSFPLTFFLPTTARQTPFHPPYSSRCFSSTHLSRASLRSISLDLFSIRPSSPRPQTLRHPPTPHPVRHHWATPSHGHATNGRAAPYRQAGTATFNPLLKHQWKGGAGVARACSASHSVVALPGGSAGPMRTSTARCEAAR